jgi:signal transduction histidine kinase
MRIDATVGTACVVQGSRTALHQILTNLVDNALKYGPEGQTVRIDAGRDNGSVRLSVEDEGPGVPETERTRIWEPYRRLPTDVTGHVRGTGIGLAVVAELAAALGGRAWVEDGDPRGSRFVVELTPHPPVA